MLNNSNVILGSTQIRYENRQIFKCRSFHVSNRRDWVQYLSDHCHFTAWNGFTTFEVVHTTAIQFIKDTHYQDLKWKCPTMIWKCPPGSFWHNINILLPYCHIHPKVSHSEGFPPRFFECLQLKKFPWNICRWHDKVLLINALPQLVRKYYCLQEPTERAGCLLH